jgi:hypothetical protein
MSDKWSKPNIDSLVKSNLPTNAFAWAAIQTNIIKAIDPIMADLVRRRVFWRVNPIFNNIAMPIRDIKHD